MIRLQKYLADAGICSRRKGEEYIRQGRVRVNGEVVTLLGTRIDPAKDRVEVDGRPVAGRESFVYIMLNKPKGVITSCSHRGEKIVMDLVDIDARVFPVGRLDKDSTGLLILTNDGALHQRLSHPSFDHEKEYEVETAAPLSDQDLDQMARGVVIDSRKTRSAAVTRMGRQKFSMVLQEGRKRQIRRMVETVGNRVVALHRVRIATLRLGGLEMSKWRHLSETELKQLISCCFDRENKDRDTGL